MKDLWKVMLVSGAGYLIAALIAMYFIFTSGCTYHVTGRANIAIPNQGQAGVELELKDVKPKTDDSLFGSWFSRKR